MTPRLSENFGSAALRHWGDAQNLMTQNRLAGADHHVGIAAECAVKHALKQHIPQPNVPRIHMDRLWGNATTLIDANQFPELNSLFSLANPFTTWDIADRYAESIALEADIATKDNGNPRWQHRQETTAKLLQYAGLIP